MPLPTCPGVSGIVEQTLFLGASVSSIVCNKGWSGQSSQLTVNLIEDDGGVCGSASQFPGAGQGTTPSTEPYDIDSDTGEYVAKGKLYYEFRGPGSPGGPGGSPPPGFFSYYWKDPDPGFLGVKNRLDTSGVLTTTLNEEYDIIGVPVYFKIGSLTYGGLVQSWSRTFNSGGKGYSVVIEGMEGLLQQCWMILDDFGGAVYCEKAINTLTSEPTTVWGGPRNYLGPNATYSGPIFNGNTPNVFNIYGFLESFGKGNFGSSNKNDNGIRVNDIIAALSVLTSTDNASNTLSGGTHNTLQSYGNKHAFSPFGRIISKSLQTQHTFTPATFAKMGIIPAVVNSISSTNGSHCEFVLDLSELPVFPDDYRILSKPITIMDFITQITKESGYDFHISLNPKYYNNQLINVIKVHTISRLKQPIPNEITNTVNSLLCQGYAVSNFTNGKEKNETQAKKILIGGKQQRLYQAKSLRLAYSQSSFILNPYTYQFIDYAALTNGLPLGVRTPLQTILNPYHHGKIKVPAFTNTRNLILASGINPRYGDYYAYEDTFGQENTSDSSATPSGLKPFVTADPVWNDNVQLAVGGSDTSTGNFEIAQLVTEAGSEPPTALGPPSAGVRFIPIYLDVICPFFGYVSDNEYTVSASADNNEFRRIRPVYYDSWTGQIIIVLKIHELPLTHINLEGFYSDRGVGAFIVTESEIRAALADFDSFLVYCLAKSYKPDLIAMVEAAYRKKYYDQYVATGRPNAAALAFEKANWSWKLFAGSMSGPEGLPGEPSSDIGQGEVSIDAEALQDLKILWGFVSQLGEYYGKKYMVSAPYVRSYKDEQYADITLSSGSSDILVFQGGGKLYYNYEPAQDGAWEEYGNYIDNTIMVGGSEWYNLSTEEGLIPPILGYNANNVIDYYKYNLCLISDAQFDKFVNLGKLSEFWNYQAYDYMRSLRDNNCDTERFMYEGLNLSQLPSSSYVSVRVSGTTTVNAFKQTVPSGGWMKKIYTPAKVDPNFAFLNPETLIGPKILVEAERSITLNSINGDLSTDPNRTVIATVASEDLGIYFRSGRPSNRFFIRVLGNYISAVPSGEMSGSYSNNANASANFVQIAEKAAHPLFVGIPIKHNQYTYGPWTSFPHTYQNTIFPTGIDISLLPNTMPFQCSGTSVVTGSVASGINNIIGSSVEVDEELVPWKFGGMGFLDIVAFNRCEQDLNFQTTIETAQIEMPGLPIFNLGMGFSSGNITAVSPAISGVPFVYTDIKDNNLSPTYSFLPVISGAIPTGLMNYLTTTEKTLTYNVLQIPGMNSYTSGPIISNIQLSIGQNGLNTTYIFRTYTPKIGLFNKVIQDKIVKNFKEGLHRNKTLSSISRDAKNLREVQERALLRERLNKIEFMTSETFRSKLFGWSPGTVLVAQAGSNIPALETVNTYIDITGVGILANYLSGTPTVTSTVFDFVQPSAICDDTGISGMDLTFEGPGGGGCSSIPSFANLTRYRTNVGLYETKELESQINNNYGLQSIMSLDGIFSPVSFFPTLRNSTFSLGLYNSSLCPFCKSTKQIDTAVAKYKANGDYSIVETKIYCNKCGNLYNNNIDSLSSTATTTAGTQSIETLPPYIISSGTDISILQNFKSLAGVSASTSSSTTTNSSNNSGGAAGVSIPINMATLNPIIVPYGNMSNTNVQNYTGEHPEGIHSGINSIGAYAQCAPRTFVDRCRHAIQVVGRGSVRPINLDTHNNLFKSLINKHNTDYYNIDLLLNHKLGSGTYPNNQRFIGLKGPIVMHSWGYDLEGYPVPNAADEPYEINGLNQPKRFKIKIKDGYPKNMKLSEVPYGGIFVSGDMQFVKKNNYIFDEYGNKFKADEYGPGDINVSGYLYEDDLGDTGGFGVDYQGNIISKTQKWEADANNPQVGKWTQKKKLKEFYLNWGERPDLWPVGPIDLRWDAARRVWTIKSSDAATIYKMVYVTLEEDLVKDDDVDDTYPARGFLDDLEYSTEPLGAGLRRLVFVKDRAGYTAPRGAKLLCRYDKDTGFYEPVSKSSFIAKGTISPGTNNANIEMSYAPGKKKGEPYPTMMVNFDNPFNLPTTENKGLFTFLNSKWVLTTSK